MRVLVFELDHHGHRMQYVRVLIEALGPLSKDLVLFTSVEAAASEEYKTHLDGVTSSFRLETLQHFVRGTPMGSALRKLEAFRIALRNCRPDHVYVPYADGLAQILGAAHMLGAISLLDGVENEGIVMRGRFAYPPNHWYEHLRTFAWLAATRMSPFQVLHQLDPIPYAAIKRIRGELSDRTRIIPEPVESIPRLAATEARRQVGIPIDGRYIISLGSGDLRKGTHLLLQAFARAKLATNDRLLLMGKLDSEIRALVTAQMGPWLRDGRLIIIDQYLSHELFCLGLNAADVICAPYPRHMGSSGIIVRAAAAERPVLASEFGWVGAVTQAFRLGQTCPVDDLEQFAKNIRESLDLASTYRLSEGGRRFTSFHTLQNFSAHLTARIHARLGHQPTIKLIPWEDVMAAAEPIPTLLCQ